MSTAVLNNQASANAVGGSSVHRESTSIVPPTMHRNTPEEWLALSEDEFKVAILERAKHARKYEERYSWEETRQRSGIQSNNVTPFKDEAEMKDFAVSLLGEVWK